MLINGRWLPSIQFFIPAKVNCSALPAVWTISGQSVSGPETPDQAGVSDYRFLEGDTTSSQLRYGGGKGGIKEQ